eukprot:9244164-Lingulodinium_polyedra.AAC.1
MRKPVKHGARVFKHLFMFANGVLDHAYVLTPKLAVADDVIIDVVTDVDSDWAGCNATRKFRSGG